MLLKFKFQNEPARRRGKAIGR